jgi:transcriptional regulator of acetoin/glycerol metabolism
LLHASRSSDDQVNRGAIPRELLESEFFGYSRGAVGKILESLYIAIAKASVAGPLSIRRLQGR